ncbi:hypothetical protein [Caenispirillum salinarum]|uniref:hypothetical protein n=1 Tax=Caenispirillum salinarum TaxID=859058 RepID=UPI0038514E81
MHFFYEAYTIREEIDEIIDYVTKFTSYWKTSARGSLIPNSILEDFESVKPHIEKFDLKIYSAIDKMRPINKNLALRLEKIIEDGEVCQNLNHLSISILLSRSRSGQESFRYNFLIFLENLVQTAYGIKDAFNATSKREVFTAGGQEINLTDLLASLMRARSIVDELVDIIMKRDKIHNNIFETHNIDKYSIIEKLDKAIEEINRIPRHLEDHRKLLRSHLEVARDEAGSDSPDWRKIIGALFIASAIISSLADLPDAINYVYDASNSIITAINEIINESTPDLSSGSKSIFLPNRHNPIDI